MVLQTDTSAAMTAVANHVFQSAERKSLSPPFLVFGPSSSIKSFFKRENADFFTAGDLDELAESEDCVLGVLAGFF